MSAVDDATGAARRTEQWTGRHPTHGDLDLTRAGEGLVELGELSTQPLGLGLGHADRCAGVGDVTPQVLVGALEWPDEAAQTVDLGAERRQLGVRVGRHGR